MIQVVLIFGAKTWVVTPHMGKALGGFQNQVVRRDTGQLPQRKTDRIWTYNSVAVANEAAGFLAMEEYVRRRHKAVAQYIAVLSLSDLCEGMDRTPGARVGMR